VVDAATIDARAGGLTVDNPTPGTSRQDAVVTLGPDVSRTNSTVTIRVARPDRTQTTTFETRVAAYEKEAAGLLPPIEGLVPAPGADDVRANRCHMLDLSRAATTNPLTSPFNVPDPGKLIFEDLPMGHVTVAGIPMRILDPAANGGKAFVVLNGANQCSTLPTEAVIPADVRGRYLCILGNVTGWGATDAGVGPAGAVAEYEIRYADGTADKMPLITGRTADDWTSAEAALDVEVAMQHGVWHLNLLTVALKPKPAKNVVIRDLGTRASPVVAAMTIVE
jgi:hypothetical protein